VIRLRSIGDTVLSTPSLIALRRHLPDAKIDILLEDWVAPVLDGFESVNEVIPVGRGAASRVRTAWDLRRRRYDVVFNLHGGTTATFFSRATGAPHRVGYADYQYARLHNHLISSSSDYWGRAFTHSAEQQLALLGSAGIPVDDLPRSSLAVTEAALRSLEEKLPAKPLRRKAVALTYEGSAFEPERSSESGDPVEDDRFGSFALIHPSTAFSTKQWAPENYARIAEYLAARGIKRVAIASKGEAGTLQKLNEASRVPIITLDDLTLPEITALASRASLFVGNDSGIAHIAAAVGTPSVVIFGSSNRNHWRPWTDAPNEIVFEPFACQPCAGYRCEVYGEPRCILGVQPANVIAAIDRVLAPGTQAPSSA
jgi:ADP-heptose:LPS heptosyltransferase